MKSIAHAYGSSEPTPRRELSTAPAIRRIAASDRPQLAELIAWDGLFTPEEVTCALELVDGALASPDGDYRVLVADTDGRLSGYVCYGPTPMTDGTWDLYWIVTHPARRSRGVASQLAIAMEDDVRRQGGRRVRVETSHTESYGSAHRFYERNAYPEVARLRDFYKTGDDLVIMMKALD